jgi:hypothetical protein
VPAAVLDDGGLPRPLRARAHPGSGGPVNGRLNRVLYRVLVLACRLLRHPSKRTQWAGGGAETRCPCGHILMTDRGFRA